MSRFLQVFGQPGAHSLYTIFAGHVCAMNDIMKGLKIYVFCSACPNAPLKEFFDSILET